MGGATGGAGRNRLETLTMKTEEKMERHMKTDGDGELEPTDANNDAIITPQRTQRSTLSTSNRVWREAEEVMGNKSENTQRKLGSCDSTAPQKPEIRRLHTISI